MNQFNRWFVRKVIVGILQELLKHQLWKNERFLFLCTRIIFYVNLQFVTAQLFENIFENKKHFYPIVDTSNIETKICISLHVRYLQTLPSSLKIKWWYFFVNVLINNQLRSKLRFNLFTKFEFHIMAKTDNFKLDKIVNFEFPFSFNVNRYKDRWK